MTSILIHSLCAYLTNKDVKWRNDDHRANKIVKSFKNEPFNGYVELNDNGVRRRFTYENRNDIVRIIVPVLARKIEELCSGAFYLVPVPSSDGTAAAASYRTLDLASKIAASMNRPCQSLGIIRWKNERDPQHKKLGRRHMSLFYNDMILTFKPQMPVVLVDDVVTSGSQMLASSYILEKSGCNIVCGLTVGRASSDQEQAPLEWKQEKYSQDPFIMQA